ncbi:hypothetical protein, partial [Vibrio rotiferianus]|uniref:hypothetical protein n=1 Tax=Vibrio rotiferianus TaxID=190895 RepID=UPI003908E0CA
MDRTSLVSYQEQVVVIGLDGHIRILSEGSQPRNGEIIVERLSQSDLKVEFVKDEQSTDVSDDIAQIIETLESGEDPTQLSEEFATAAGTANGSSYQLTATLERSASEILATTDFQTSGLQDLGVSQTQTLSLLEAYLNFNQVISSASGNPDTLAPSVPTVVITEDSNNDGSLENNEVDGLVDVLVTLPANAEVGDTLSVTGQPDRVITQNDLDNGVTLQYPVPAEGETLTVVATITDQAGNTSDPGQDAVTVPTVEVPDTDAPDAPTVVITEDSNNDGLLENNEVDGLVDVLVTLPANAEVGDTLSVTGQPDRVITQNDLDKGVTLQYPVPAEGETLSVVATITDQAGNTSEPGQAAVTVPTVEVPDTDAPDAPTVVITEDSNNDGSLENNEVDGLVDVLVTLPANAEVGDTLSVTGQPDRVITQNDLDNGVTLQYPVPAEGETLTVVATITDQAGNTSPEAQDSVTIPEYIGDVVITTVSALAIEGESSASFQISRTPSQGESTGSESTVTFKFDTSVADSVDINDIESVTIGETTYTDDALKTLFNEGVELTLTDAESISVVVTPKDDADIEGLESLVGQIVAGEGASILPGNDKANATINDESVDRNEPADVSIETVLGAAVEGESNASFKITRTAEQDEPTGSESTVTFKFDTSVADSVDIDDIDSVKIGDVVYTGEGLAKLFNDGIELTLTGAESISVVVTPKDDTEIEGLENLVGQIVAGEGATIPNGGDKANATINDETVDRNEVAEVSIKTVDAAAVEGESTASFAISRTEEEGEPAKVTFKFDTSVADSVDIDDIDSVKIGETTYTGDTLKALFDEGIELTLTGAESISVVVTPKDDTEIEGLENLVGQIVAGEGATIPNGGDKANATINDETVDRNEVAEVSIKTVDAAAVEGESTA